jgi:hypothetical protein
LPIPFDKGQEIVLGESNIPPDFHARNPSLLSQALHVALGGLEKLSGFA